MHQVKSKFYGEIGFLKINKFTSKVETIKYTSAMQTYCGLSSSFCYDPFFVTCDSQNYVLFEICGHDVTGTYCINIAYQAIDASFRPISDPKILILPNSTNESISYPHPINLFGKTGIICEEMHSNRVVFYSLSSSNLNLSVKSSVVLTSQTGLYDPNIYIDNLTGKVYIFGNDQFWLRSVYLINQHSYSAQFLVNYPIPKTSGRCAGPIFNRNGSTICLL